MRYPRAEDSRTEWAAQHAIVELGKKLAIAIERRAAISTFRLREANNELERDERAELSCMRGAL